MRFIPIRCLKKNSVLSKDIYKDNKILLSNGSILNEINIKSLKAFGINGVYVNDDISINIEIKDIISEKLRASTTKIIKDVFMKVSDGNISHANNDIVLISNLIREITEDIINNKTLMASMIDLKFFDDYTFHHSVNVAVISLVMGVSLLISKDELYSLGMNALLHDIGKVFIDSNIVNKKGILTEKEFAEVKNHPYLGYDYLINILKLDKESYMGALQHHEKFDGTGYPFGLKGNEISLHGRIIAIADVYDALISKRPYREAMLPSEAVEYIISGNASFDIDLVKVFSRKISPYPIGTLVRLSDQRIGIVEKNIEGWGLRPSLRILRDDCKKTPYILDLINDRNSYKTTIINVIQIMD